MLNDRSNRMAAGKSVTQVIQHLGVSGQTYHRWRNPFGGMKSEAATRLKELDPCAPHSADAALGAGLRNARLPR